MGDSIPEAVAFFAAAFPMGTVMRPLVLASSSPYRRELLQRLQLPFISHSPSVNEHPLPDESPQELVRRLATAKACALRHKFLQHLIIGSDQVAELDGRIIGKPGTRDRAIAQLMAFSGRSLTFHTGLCLLDSASQSLQVDCVPFTVHFRELKRPEIERYIDQETPLDCAGSFKSEGLGISLFRATEGADATSLVGLPLIRLCDMLRTAGVRLP